LLLLLLLLLLLVVGCLLFVVFFVFVFVVVFSLCSFLFLFVWFCFAELLFALLAKVSQSTNRGTCMVDGRCPTLTTSSRLWSFKLHRFLLPEELMRCHGLDGYSFRGLTKAQARELIGNSMSSTTLVMVLAGCLYAMDRLVKK